MVGLPRIEGAALGQQAVIVANQGNCLAIGQMVEQDGGVADVIMVRPPHGAVRVSHRADPEKAGSCGQPFIQLGACRSQRGRGPIQTGDLRQGELRLLRQRD